MVFSEGIEGQQLFEKETPQVFFCEICENAFFIEHLGTTASGRNCL